MTLRLYLDEDSMDRTLVRALRSRAIDVLTAAEAGMIERSDAENLEFSTREQRVLCTFNIAHFWTLHAEYLAAGRSHAGMILMHQQRYGIGEQLRRLLRLTTRLSPDEMMSRAEFLSAWDPLG